MKSVPKVGATPFIYKTIYGDSIFNAAAIDDGALKMILNFTVCFMHMYVKLKSYLFQNKCTYNHTDFQFVSPTKIWISGNQSKRNANFRKRLLLPNNDFSLSILLIGLIGKLILLERSLHVKKFKALQNWNDVDWIIAGFEIISTFIV